MDISIVVGIIVDVLLLPLQLVLVPIDALLSHVPGLSAVPAAIGSIFLIIGSIPATIVGLIGLNPVLWNILVITFVLYITAAPGINLLKKMWAWVRP